MLWGWESAATPAEECSNLLLGRESETATHLHLASQIYCRKTKSPFHSKPLSPPAKLCHLVITTLVSSHWHKLNYLYKITTHDLRPVCSIKPLWKNKSILTTWVIELLSHLTNDLKNTGENN